MQHPQDYKDLIPTLIQANKELIDLLAEVSLSNRTEDLDRRLMHRLSITISKLSGGYRFFFFPDEQYEQNH